MPASMALGESSPYLLMQNEPHTLTLINTKTMKHNVMAIALLCSGVALADAPKALTCSTNYCPGGQYYSPPPQGKRTDYGREQLRYIAQIKESIKRMDEKNYTELMDKLDTAYYIGFKHWWLSYNNHRRVMREGTDMLDLNQAEVDFLWNIVHVETKNASWRWCRGVLDAYTRRHGETGTSISPSEPQVERPVSIFPNPSDGQIIFDFGTEIPIKMEICDVAGGRVSQHVGLESRYVITGLPAGSYLVRLQYSDNSEPQYHRIVVVGQ